MRSVLGPPMSGGTDWNVFCMEAGGVGALFRQSAFLAEDAFSADHTSHSEIPCKQRHMALPRPLGGRRAGGGRWPPVHAMGGWIPPIGPLGGGGARVCYPRSWKGRHRASSDRHFEGVQPHTDTCGRPGSENGAALCICMAGSFLGAPELPMSMWSPTGEPPWRLLYDCAA